jgi:hypothetical protein
MKVNLHRHVQLRYPPYAILSSLEPLTKSQVDPVLRVPENGNDPLVETEGNCRGGQ